MQEFSIPMKYITLIAACYNGSSCQVCFANRLSAPFTVKSGLRQGDPLSPLLFNIALERVGRAAGLNRVIEMVGSETILHLQMMW